FITEDSQSHSVLEKGEKITLRCEIQGQRNTQWVYDWTTASSNGAPSSSSSSSSEYVIHSATLSDSGDYRCRGIKDLFYSTQWSNNIKLFVLCKLEIFDLLYCFTIDTVSLFFFTKTNVHVG
uniref:Ig-like domain-containing protein n=1 Tax=Echeneis naucrates TaxID=173247 RepID=A0A665WWG4_ECHNA